MFSWIARLSVCGENPSGIQPAIKNIGLSHVLGTDSMHWVLKFPLCVLWALIADSWSPKGWMFLGSTDAVSPSSLRPFVFLWSLLVFWPHLSYSAPTADEFVQRVRSLKCRTGLSLSPQGKMDFHSNICIFIWRILRNLNMSRDLFNVLEKTQ